MVKYRVTVVKFGLGFSSADAIARQCEEHLSEIAAEGWRLVHADRNSAAIPGYWTFIWERTLAPTSDDKDGSPAHETATPSFGIKPA